MATKNPRITVTLSPRAYEVINAIASMGGGSMSGFIAETLDGALPTLERMAATIHAVKQAQDQQKAKILASLDEAHSELEPVVMAAVGQFDLFLGKMEEAAAQSTAGVADARSVAAENPRPVITGVNPPKKGPKQRGRKGAGSGAI